MSDYEKLIMIYLIINGKLKIVQDHVEHDLSMKELENFKELLNRLWWKENGWEEK